MDLDLAQGLEEAGSLCHPQSRLEASISLDPQPPVHPQCLLNINLDPSLLSTHTMVSSQDTQPIQPLRPPSTRPRPPSSPRLPCHQPRPPWRPLHL